MDKFFRQSGHNPWRTTGSQPSRGVIGLFTVIILGAMVLSIGLVASYTAQTELLMVGSVDRGQYARQLASSCLDEALYRLKKDSSYTGGTVPILSSICQVVVTGSGTTWTIAATAVDGESTKTLSVGAELRVNNGGNANSWYVQSWEEVDP